MQRYDRAVLGNPDPPKGEGPFPESMVETRGYMTSQQQIQRLIAAGEIHQAWRNATFPPETNVPDDYVPPDYAPSELDVLDEARQVVAGRSRAAARKAVHEAKMAESAEEEPAVEPASTEPVPE